MSRPEALGVRLQPNARGAGDFPAMLGKRQRPPASLGKRRGPEFDGRHNVGTTEPAGIEARQGRDSAIPRLGSSRARSWPTQ